MFEQIGALAPVLQALIATLFTWGVTALGAALVFFFKNDPQTGAQRHAGVRFRHHDRRELLVAAGPRHRNGPGRSYARMARRGHRLHLGRTVLIPRRQAAAAPAPGAGPQQGGGRQNELAAQRAARAGHHAAQHPRGGWPWASRLARRRTDYPRPPSRARWCWPSASGCRTFPKARRFPSRCGAKASRAPKRFCTARRSGIVEPIAGIIGVLAVGAMRSLLPYALSFAAGAMIYVVVEELIPESQQSGSTDVSTAGCMIGFAVMMVLDVALG